VSLCHKLLQNNYKFYCLYFPSGRYGLLIDPVQVTTIFLEDPYRWPSASLVICKYSVQKYVVNLYNVVFCKFVSLVKRSVKQRDKCTSQFETLYSGLKTQYLVFRRTQFCNSKNSIPLFILYIHVATHRI